jgi:hypothetical protein
VGTILLGFTPSTPRDATHTPFLPAGNRTPLPRAQMFHDDAVAATDRIDKSTSKSMVWAQLPVADKESEGRAGGGSGSGGSLLCR